MTTPPAAPLACRHHPACPGCPLIDRPYDQQLASKRERLVRALARYPHLELPEVEPIVGAVRTAGYRHRLKLPVHVAGEQVRIGLYGPDHRVLHTPDCPVLAPELRDTLRVLVEWLRGRAGVHSIDLRVSVATGEQMLVLACRGSDVPGGPRAVRELRRRAPALASVAVSRADPEGKRVMGRAPEVVAGARWIEEQIGQTRYRLHPGAFFQVDPLQAEQIHHRVRDHVGPARTVLDLYAGVGAYGLMLAPGRSRVVLVEEVTQAADGARAVAPPNVEVLARKVEDVAFDRRFDAAVINPARRGSDPESLRRLAGWTDRLVYVSCGPETLARDLDILAAHGLRVERITPIDLFPQTPEVETVVTLVRGPPLTRWTTPGGAARTPWLDGGPSGAPGKPKVLIALVLGDTRPRGSVDGARFERIGTVAGHSLLRVQLSTTPSRALAGLKAVGHALVGKDPKTAPFFAEKGGLVRPFVHVERDDRGDTAPLHGDLAEVIDRLGGASGRSERKSAPARGRRRR
ncbi:MAG: hypothetical protein ABMA64_13945 [Myxococcota bacterium]